MHSYSRRRPFAFVWAVILSLLLSACVTISGGPGGSGSSMPGNSADAGADNSAGAAAPDGTASGGAAGGSNGSGDGTGDGPNQPQRPAPGEQPRPPAPGQPQRPAPGQPAAPSASGQPPAQPPGPAAPGQPPAQPPAQAPGPAAPGQPPAQPPGPPAPGQPPPQPPAQPPGPPAPGRPPAPEAAVLDWLPIGPVGRGDPIWYVRLKDRDCDKLEDVSGAMETMDQAAKKLCLGLNGDQAAWAEGAAALETMAEPDPGDCWSAVAYKKLRDVAAFRRQKPDVPIKLAAVSGTACKPNLAALQDDAGDSPPISVCAGAAIVLVGTLGGLPVGSLRTVNVGTTTVQVRHRKSLEDNNYPFGEFFFLAPTPVPGEPTTVNVAFADADWSVEGSASFEYAADQSTCPPSPGSIQ